MGGPLKKDRLFLFGNYEGFRQALALSSVSVVPDSQARQGLLPNAATGVYAPVIEFEQIDAAVHGVLAAGKRSRVAIERRGERGGLSYNNPKESIREDFGTVRADYLVRDRDTLSAVYTIDDGNSLIPLADPLFASFTALRMQVASVEETHIFSPQILNTFRAGYSRAAFNLDSSLLASFPASLSFVNGGGPGGIVINGGVTTTGNNGTITSAGPNNAAGAWNRRNLFTYSDTVSISKGRHQISTGVWLQRLDDNENTASRQLGAGELFQLDHFSARHGDHVPGAAQPQ